MKLLFLHRFTFIVTLKYVIIVSKSMDVIEAMILIRI